MFETGREDRQSGLSLLRMMDPLCDYVCMYTKGRASVPQMVFRWKKKLRP